VASARPDRNRRAGHALGALPEVERRQMAGVERRQREVARRLVALRPEQAGRLARLLGVTVEDAERALKLLRAGRL
jgi:hypothetical protein